MSIILPLSFLLLQAALLALGAPVTAPVAYIAMVAAPLLAGLACGVRARRERGPARLGWVAAALGLGVWSMGSFDNLWQEMVLGHQNEMYRGSMLLFNLSTVPFAFLVAGEWRPGPRRWTRLVDGAIALGLAYVYFLYTWSRITDRAQPEELGVAWLVGLIDAQNLFIALGLALRWASSQEAPERDLFRSLSIYQAVFFCLVLVNDHVFAGDDEHYGPAYGSVISLAFAVLAHLALRPAGPSPVRRASLGFERAVLTASPLVLATALLMVSLFLIRIDYPIGSAGVVLAVLGVGARSTLAQVRHLRHSHVLQRQTTELQAIAWTDALTGIANRHFLDQALRRAWQTEMHARRSLGVLMIDIDHFKQLNDQYGHLTGDSCLRAVARSLQAALVRPDDVLARYGGEEFIALLQGVDLEGALVVAERLRKAVRELKFPNGGSPFGLVTISIGVASAILGDDVSPDRLVQLADRALYDAKCQGRDQVCSCVDGDA